MPQTNHGYLLRRNTRGFTQRPTDPSPLYFATLSSMPSNPPEADVMLGVRPNSIREVVFLPLLSPSQSNELLSQPFIKDSRLFPNLPLLEARKLLCRGTQDGV